MFFQRAIITFTLGPLALFLIYKGGWFYFIPVAAFLLLAAHEYVHLFRKLNWNLPLSIVMTAVAAQLIIGQFFTLKFLALALIFSLLAAMAYALLLYERGAGHPAIAIWMTTSFGILLVGWLGAHFFLLRRVENMAWQWTMLAMLGTWITDSAAYVVGKFLAGNILGKHKMAPRLSPNKTFEGYVGGILFGTLITLSLGKYFGLPILPVLILGLLISIISPLGDLGISLLKREVKMKDSGTLLPGHGGALDRIDSLIWSVAMAYYLADFVY